MNVIVPLIGSIDRWTNYEDMLSLQCSASLAPRSQGTPDTAETEIQIPCDENPELLKFTVATPSVGQKVAVLYKYCGSVEIVCVCVCVCMCVCVCVCVCVCYVK